MRALYHEMYDDIIMFLHLCLRAASNSLVTALVRFKTCVVGGIVLIMRD